MAKKGRLRRARAIKQRSRSGRFAALTLGTGVAIILVFALVFSIAYGTRSIASHASALHNADEALRAATIIRAQAGLATHLNVLEQDFGWDSSEGIDLSVSEVRLALDDLDSALAGLISDVDGLSNTIVTGGRNFRITTFEILDGLEGSDAGLAQQIATEELDLKFRGFVDALVIERDHQAVSVATANATMGRVGDMARFLVAFLVPTAAIILYRELSRREARRKELEVRLETEQDLGQARDDFIANASHELRTPLTSILGLAYLIDEEDSVEENPMITEMVGLIISEANDLSRMVDDLLTTARLDAGALHFQLENLNAVEEIEEVVGPLQRSGAAISVQAQPSLVRSDRLRLRQVIRNLLSNARKYGGPNVRVVAEPVSGWFEIRVEDDGAGIPDELRDRLFQRYLHEGDMPTVLGSVGLGLSIVGALAEGMGGAVWYERRDGWTSFVVRIPLATDDEISQFREAPGSHPEIPMQSDFETAFEALPSSPGN
jgi:signal transduction histidine kinase